MPYFHSGFHATSSLESMDQFLRRALPPRFLKQMSHASHAAKTKDKTVDFISSSWKSSISSSLSPAAQQNRKCREKQHQQQEESTIEIVFKDAATNQEVNMTIGISTMLKHAFTNYSEERGISLRSSRFVYQGKTLFLSSVGHKTPAQLGMQNLDVILSSCTSNNSNKSSPSTMGENRSQSQQHPSSAIKQRRNNKSKAKSKKRSPKSSKISSSYSSVINTLEIHHDDQCKIDHSKNLSRLFEEAEVQFKEIRQRLHALNIERTKPKIKTSHKKKSTNATATTANLINNPSMDGLGGKAGKTRFVVQVGEVNNLYKTSKPSQEQQHQQHSIVTTDLHGLTKQEALTKLNECLPQWTNLAMHGSYPFVQPVIIVCGGGNQILSETVDHWIKRNDTVSNAPKSSLIGGR